MPSTDIDGQPILILSREDSVHMGRILKSFESILAAYGASLQHIPVVGRIHKFVEETK